MRDHFAELLTAFGQEIGIPDLAFDANGTCSLIFDDMVVNIEKNTEGEKIFLYSTVGTIPATDKEPFYKMLLEANAFFKGTGGGTLAIDEPSCAVLFLYQMSVKAMDNAAFSRTIENFINITEHWVNKLNGQHASQDSVGSDAPRHVGMRV